MKTICLALCATAAVAAAPLVAQETREMEAHVHGVSTLEIAIENGVVEMSLLSPGMDIVGFEYAASSDADKDAVEAAIRTMLVPENIVTLPAAAECRLGEVLAHLHAGDDHADDDDHDGHEAHAEDEEHAHEEHDHAHDDHAEDNDHDHDGGATHSAFHVRYIFECEHPEDLTKIGFPFFERFEHAAEIEAQYITETGAGAFEIDRDAAELTLN